MFQDRIDAGDQLANALIKYQRKGNVMVIGLPRGGVPVAYEAAQKLHLPLDIVCPRKIGAPMNKEFAIGAVTESGEGIFNEDTVERFSIPKAYIDEEVKQESKMAKHRLDIYRKGRPQRNVKGKTVILIDDGLATGATMKAAIKTMKSEGAASIIVAIPVAPEETLKEIKLLANEVVCLSSPSYFQAVGQFYQDFTPTEDEEVIELLKLETQANQL